MEIKEVIDRLENLKKFCERKATSRWKEDEIMWGGNKEAIELAIKVLKDNKDA